MPEKLLERALEKGATFREIRREGPHALLIQCDAASAALLQNECVRFRLPANVLECRGRSAFSAWARKRATLPAGLLVFAALCWLFLGRVWWIDCAFTGEAADSGDRALLESAVADAGIHPGMRRDADWEALAEDLKAGAGNYSYVGAHLRGVRLVIEAVPEVPSPDLYDVSAARDLVADRDGVVLSAVAQSGELCVQPGDAVMRGQLLIRGEELAEKGEDGPVTEPIAALGEVIVRTWAVGEASLPTTARRLRLTGKSAASSRLVTPWLSFDITGCERYPDQVTTKEVLPIGGVFLPVEIERVTNRQAVREEVRLDTDILERQLSALAFSDAALKLERSGPGDYEIRKRWIDFAASGDRLTARAVIEISANAAVTRDTLN